MSLDKYRKVSSDETPAEPSASNSSNPVTIKDRVGIFLFGFIFFAAGCAGLWFLGVKPYLIRQAAQDWPAVEAVVTSSSVDSHRSDDSTTYSFEVLYSYNFEGKQYKSDKYKPFNSSSSDYSAAARLHDKYPRGTTVTAYVNPEDPYYAIMNRKTEGSDYFALFTLIFVAVGGVIIYSAFTVTEIKKKSNGAYSLSNGPRKR